MHGKTEIKAGATSTTASAKTETKEIKKDVSLLVIDALNDPTPTKLTTLLQGENGVAAFYHICQQGPSKDIHRCLTVTDGNKFQELKSAHKPAGWPSTHLNHCLMIAALENRGTLLYLALELGADPNVITPGATTMDDKAGLDYPLRKAAFLGHLDIVKGLLARGADLEAATGGRTAVHAAANNNQVKMLDYLLEYPGGASLLWRKDVYSLTPLELAQQQSPRTADAAAKLKEWTTQPVKILTDQITNLKLENKSSKDQATRMTEDNKKLSNQVAELQKRLGETEAAKRQALEEATRSTEDRVSAAVMAAKERIAKGNDDAIARVQEEAKKSTVTSVAAEREKIIREKDTEKNDEIRKVLAVEEAKRKVLEEEIAGLKKAVETKKVDSVSMPHITVNVVSPSSAPPIQSTLPPSTASSSSTTSVPTADTVTAHPKPIASTPSASPTAALLGTSMTQGILSPSSSSSSSSSNSPLDVSTTTATSGAQNPQANTGGVAAAVTAAAKVDAKVKALNLERKEDIGGDKITTKTSGDTNCCSNIRCTIM